MFGTQPLKLAVPKLDDEAGRLAALYRYDLLDTGSEDEFEQIVQLVQRVFGVPMAAVTLIDADRQWFKARRGLAPTQTARTSAFCHHTIAAADGLAVEDAEADPRFAGTPLVLGEPHIRSYLGAPLRTPDGYQVGALCIIDNERRRFSSEDREILRQFSDVVVSQMELRQLASRDSLTRMLTRRAFDQAMFDALEAERTGGCGAALAVLDLDHFKQVNDTHGHSCGDAVLVAVAETMQAVVGTFGSIGRLGGEEFGMLIDGGDVAVVCALAEQVRLAVAAAPVSGRAVRVTASIGVAMLAPEFATAEAWLHAADTALYAAKTGGRNRVMLHKTQ